ncbi:MAG: S9 family peptidase [Actinomycetales bacterium]
MKSDQLPNVHSVSVPTLSPDASTAVVAVTRPDFAADSYVGQLWKVPLNGGVPRRFTRGFRDTAPQFSPDGTVLAFLRTVPEGKPQLYLVDAAGGEPLQLTDAELGVSGFDFAPDSRRIVFEARVPEDGRYGTVDGVGPGAEDPRLITTWRYRMNGAGYLRDKFSQLFILDVPAVDSEPAVAPAGRAKKDAGEEFSACPQARQLTDDDADHSGPVFSADGTRILFQSALHDGADAELVEDLYAVDADGGAPVRLTGTGATENFSVTGGCESADGNWLFFVAADMGAGRRDFIAAQYGIYVAPSADPAAATRLTGLHDMDFTETPRLVRSGPDAVLAVDRYRGSARVVRISAGGGVEVLSGEQRQVTGAAAAGGTVVAGYTDPGTFGDVAVVRDGSLLALTDFSAGFRTASPVIAAQERSYPGADGTAVHGWVLLPDGPGPHPVLLNIHGGPFAQYGWGIYDEAQVYADAGYAVVMCNPRGSASYGRAHGRSIREAMGTVDMSDVLAFLDGALGEFGDLAADRVGVMGGSYGGYLTAWIIAHEHRFAAAIVERGYLDPESFIGSSDIGWFFSAEYTGQDPAQRLRQSPMAVVDQVRTPTLVIHSEEDLRCPIEQGQRYYAALKARDVPAELLIFPGENHELSRAGRPLHRKSRFDHILRWWARYLPTAANPVR